MSKQTTNQHLHLCGTLTDSRFHVSDANWLPAKSFIPGLRLHSEIQAEFGADDHRRVVVVGFHSGQMLVDTLKHKSR